MGTDDAQQRPAPSGPAAGHKHNSEMLDILDVPRDQSEAVLKSRRSEESVDQGGLNAFLLCPR